MQELAQSLSSPAWWFSAVIVALLINLLSAYVKPPFDRLLSKVSESWRNRSAKALETFRSQVKTLALSQNAMAAASENEIRRRLRGLTYLLFGLTFLLFPVWLDAGIQSPTVFDKHSAIWWFVVFTKVYGVLLFWWSNFEISAAVRLSGVIQTARELLIELDQKK